MSERVSHLFQRTPVPEDTASTDTGDYTTASDEGTASGSNDESCADSGGTDYATADEDIASDSIYSPGISEGNVLLVTEHSASISPGIATTSTTPSHQPPPSLSSSQAQETQHRPPSQGLQASSLLFSQEQLPSIPLPQAQEVQLPDQQFQASQPPSSIPLSQAQEVQQQSQTFQPPSSIPQFQALVQLPDQQFQASQPPSSIPLSQAQKVQPPDQQFQASTLSASQAHTLSSYQPCSSIPSSQVQSQGSHQCIPLPQAQGAQLSSHKSLSTLSSQAQPTLSSGAGTRGDSLESKALCKLSDELVNAISASNPLISWKLLARDLIRPETVDYCQLEVTQTKKSSKIVCAVIETVSASPHLFESLVSVLSESGNTALMSVGEKLKQTYKSINEGFTDSLPSSRVQEVQLPSHSPSSHQLPPPPSQPKSPELCLYAKYLRAVYTRSKLPVYSKWPPSPGKRFINLAIISKEGISKEEADEFTKATLHGDLEEILKIKAPIKLEDILRGNPEEELRCILIEGAPGVGKTTLSWEVCHRWGKGELYQEYSIVVLLRLRDQNVQRAKRVADLFYHSNEDIQKVVTKEIANSDGSGTLIILEGLDELPNDLISESSIFTRLLSGTELPHATILVTSRPSATYKLWENWKEHISRHIEILGFTDDNITEYTQSVLPVDEQSKFEDYLSIHPYIRLMLYIPLHCAIVTVIYMQCQQFNRPLPKTITELYTYLTQAILIRYLKSHSEYKDKDYSLDTLSNLPFPVYAHFLSLCKLAFEGVNDQKQVFHSLSKPIEHLGFMDAVSELFVHQQSASYSYNFLHFSVQEYLAAYHVSLMSHDEQKQLLLENANCYDHRSNMIRFLIGITKFKGQSKAIVKKVIGIKDLLSMYALELLYECQDVSILDSEDKSYTVYISTDSLHKLHSLGYCIANSRSKWILKFKHKSNIGADAICHSLKKALFSNSFISSIDFKSCSPEFTYQLLTYLPKYIIQHIESLTIIPAEPETQSLPPHLVPRMERLKTLTLETVVYTSHTELILALSRISTLRNLTLYKLNSDGIAQLCQWLPTCQLKTLTLYENTKAQKMTIVFHGDSIQAIECQYCTTEFSDQILSQISTTFVQRLSLLIDRKVGDLQQLPHCLPELIPRMERLNSLTLANVLDTSLRELIPVLSRVPTLRNLELSELNSEGIALLCQWLPTCQLETLILYEMIHSISTLICRIAINLRNKSIGCQYCTVEFIDHILRQTATQQYATHVRIFTIHNVHPQPLPSCLLELIPKMERLNTLTLTNVLATSLTKLIPVLSRVPTLRDLILPKLNSEGIAFLHQWLPTCQLKKLTVHDKTEYSTMKMTFYNSFIDAIECQYCTIELIDQILLQIPQQSITHVKAFTILMHDRTAQPQPLPSYLPEMISRMERLKTLTLPVFDSSLTDLVSVLSRVPTLRELILPIAGLNSEGIAFLCQWLPTCQLKTLKICMTYGSKVDTSLMKLLSVLSRVPTLRNLSLPELNSEGITLLCQWLPTCQLETLTLQESYNDEITITFCNNSMETIECRNCTTEFINLILSQQYMRNVETLAIHRYSHKLLPPCLHELIPRMERLNTLTLESVLPASLTKLIIPVLPRVPTLRNLKLHKLNSEGIALLHQWLPTCQLETLTLHESYSNGITITFNSNAMETIECQNCTMEFINQILSQQSMMNVGTLTICNASYSLQPLPSCLPELIPTMERLNTLTLVNVLPASLTKLIPVLPRVPALRNLTLSKLNSEGIALLCQWLPTCQLEKFTLHETTEGQKIIILFCNNSIETIDCNYCTTEFINQILSQLPQQSLTHVKTLRICSELKSPQSLPPCLSELLPTMEKLNTLTLIEALGTSVTEIIPVLLRVPTLRNLTLHELNSEGIGLLCQWQSALQLEKLQLLDSKLYEIDGKKYYHNIVLRSGRTKDICGSSFETVECYSCTEEFIIHVQLQQLALHAKSTRIEYHPMQPLPPCLIQLIPRMERLDTLTLKNVLDTSLTELTPVLSRVPTLRNLTLSKLNSEGITFLCQWPPTCQLETLTLHEQTETMLPKKVTINFCNNLCEAIECQNCTTNFINQILSQFPQQCTTHVKTLTVYNDHCQLLPPCLPELIPRIERLDTLILKNVFDNSLIDLLLALSRISILKNLRIQSFSENLQVLFHEESFLLTVSSTQKLIGMFLPQQPQQTIALIRSLTVTCVYSQEGPQPLPSCVPELIPRMEKLNTLTWRMYLILH